MSQVSFKKVKVCGQGFFGGLTSMLYLSVYKQVNHRGFYYQYLPHTKKSKRGCKHQITGHTCILCGWSKYQPPKQHLTKSSEVFVYVFRPNWTNFTILSLRPYDGPGLCISC